MEPRWKNQRRERGEFPQAKLCSLVRFGRDCRTRRVGILVKELRVAFPCRSCLSSFGVSSRNLLAVSVAPPGLQPPLATTGPELLEWNHLRTTKVTRVESSAGPVSCVGWFGRDCRTRRIGILVNELRVGRVSLPRLSLVVYGVAPKASCSRCCIVGASAPPLANTCSRASSGLAPPAPKGARRAPIEKSTY